MAKPDQQVIRPRRNWKRTLGIYFGVAISIASIVWVFNYVGTQNLFEQFKKIQASYVVLAIVLTLTGYFVRSLRWVYFFHEKVPSYSASMMCVFVGFFMNNVLPARMGEFVRAHFGGRLTNQSRATVLATIAGERLADGVMISAIFSLLYIFASTEAERREGAGVMYVSLLFGFVAVCVVIFMSQRALVFGVLHRIAARFPGRTASYALPRLERFVEGLQPMFQPRRFVILTVLSAVVWGLELAAYAQVCRAYDYEMSWGTLSLFLAAVNFSSLIPSAPGALGVIEAVATLVLVHVGVEKEIALAMVSTQHIIQYIVVGIPGAYFFFHYFRGKLPVDESVADGDSPIDLA
ncbi:MAG: flippase-like domain-containing protein [Deltaproteobacteria bacterium]|nr:flippase-like domain-containing protein [Deltaproteobacteria bacterium]